MKKWHIFLASRTHTVLVSSNTPPVYIYWFFPHQYYRTGDAGYVDEDGFLYVMTRTDDVVNVAGHRSGMNGAFGCFFSDRPPTDFTGGAK